MLNYYSTEPGTIATPEDIELHMVGGSGYVTGRILFAEYRRSTERKNKENENEKVYGLQRDVG